MDDGSLFSLMIRMVWYSRKFLPLVYLEEMLNAFCFGTANSIVK